MLKRFFISTLGTITGLWIFLILTIVTVIAVIVAAGKGEGASMPDRAILYLDLDGEVYDYPADPDLQAIVQGNESYAPTFSDMLQALERAAGDKKVSCVYLRCAGSGMGVAQREELRRALLKFRKSGKKVISYADNYTQGDYYVASVADEIHLNPVGTVDIHGIGTSVPFFTGLLDKLGVKVQVIKVGSFKSAVEPYILHSMSDSARLQTVQFVDTIWQAYAQGIGADMNVPAATVTGFADSLTATWPASRLLECEIVNKLSYRRQVENELRKLTKTDDDADLPLVTPAEYLALAQNPLKTLESKDRDYVAVLYASGDIVDGYSSGMDIAGDSYADMIVSLADDDHVKGLVLRVNSGGGSAFASEQIWEALEYFKSKDKPFNVSMGDYAASGGYYISCGADKIWADRTTLTGSIGVFGLIPDFSGLVTGKLGIEFSNVESGPNGNFISFTQPMTPAQLAAMQRNVEQTYATFVGRVAKGRGLKEADVRRIAEGRVWVGSRAVQLGLVDRIGGLEDALAATLSACKLDKYDYEVLPSPESNIWKQVLGDALRQTGAADMARAQAERSALERVAAAYGLGTDELRLVTDLRHRNPVQARMMPVSVQ